jgi:hypothetical protein
LSSFWITKFIVTIFSFLYVFCPKELKASFTCLYSKYLQDSKKIAWKISMRSLVLMTSSMLVTSSKLVTSLMPTTSWLMTIDDFINVDDVVMMSSLLLTSLNDGEVINIAEWGKIKEFAQTTLSLDRVSSFLHRMTWFFLSFDKIYYLFFTLQINIS